MPVLLRSDTITLPLFPRAIERGVFKSKKPSKTKTAVTAAKSARRFHLSKTAIIAIAIAVAVVLLIALIAFIIMRRRRSARIAPSAKGKQTAASSTDSFLSGGGHGNVTAPEPSMVPGGPRPLENHLSPNNDMQDVPLTAGMAPPPARYGYGAQVDSLRIPGMAVKPVYGGYNQPSVSHFSPN